MRPRALMLPALGALLLPAAAARGDVAGCRAELQQLAQTYHLSMGPPATNAAQSSAGATTEAPATTESRGMARGPDSLESSGGTLPPATGAENRDTTRPSQQLGANDRAKLEGLLSQGQAADARGQGDQCLEALHQAQSMLKQSGH